MAQHRRHVGVPAHRLPRAPLRRPGPTGHRRDGRRRPLQNPPRQLRHLQHLRLHADLLRDQQQEDHRVERLRGHPGLAHLLLHHLPHNRHASRVHRGRRPYRRGSRHRVHEPDRRRVGRVHRNRLLRPARRLHRQAAPARYIPRDDG